MEFRIRFRNLRESLSPMTSSGRCSRSLSFLGVKKMVVRSAGSCSGADVGLGIDGVCCSKQRFGGRGTRVACSRENGSRDLESGLYDGVVVALL